MSNSRKPWPFVAAPFVALFAGYVVQGLLCKPTWRANVAWIAGSWWHPADRESRWQQASGVEVDPWDKIMHGRRSNTRAGSGQHTQTPSAMGR